MNHKTLLIKEAKAVFLKELQEDVDFLAYKKNCIIDHWSSYGVVIAGKGTFILNKVAPSSETIIANYLKESHGRKNSNK
jgi:hypothetical protein